MASKSDEKEAVVDVLWHILPAAAFVAVVFVVAKRKRSAPARTPDPEIRIPQPLPKPVKAEGKTAIVISGGGITAGFEAYGALIELKRRGLLPKDPKKLILIGTSAGAVVLVAFALGREDELKEFLDQLQPDQIIRPKPVAAYLFGGVNDYILPETVLDFFGETEQSLGEKLRLSPRVLKVVGTNISRPMTAEQLEKFVDDLAAGRKTSFRYFGDVFSSRDTHYPAEEFTRGVFASSAIPVMVNPMLVNGDHILDGSMVDHFAQWLALGDPSVTRIFGYHHLPVHLLVEASSTLEKFKQLERFLSRLPERIGNAGGLLDELRRSITLGNEGQPFWMGSIMAAMLHITVFRNGIQEIARANDRNAVLRARLSQEEALEILESSLMHEARFGEVSDEIKGEIVGSMRQIVYGAPFPHRGDRDIECTIAFSAGGIPDLPLGLRLNAEWSKKDKDAVIERGRQKMRVELERKGL